jgi:hypothetical protein
MEVAVAAFMAAVEEEEAPTEGVGVGPEAEAGCALAEEAGSAGDRIRHLPRATEVHAPQPHFPRHAQWEGTQRGLATTILGPGVISRAGISGSEIPARRPLLSPTANGIPLAARLRAVDH